MPMFLRATRMKGFWHIASLILGLAFAILVGFYVTLNPEQNVIPGIKAAPVTVNCSGTAGAPTSVDEASLAADDVTFSDTGGDGYCELDAAISAASVLIESGVTITHVAEDTDGVNITTTGTFEIESGAFINVDEKGCVHPLASNNQNGFGPNGSNACSEGTSGFGQGGNSLQGAGGGGHGNNGGDSSADRDGGTFYGSATAPVRFGSTGGRDGLSGAGSGGGIVRLDVGTTFTHNGTISADGGDGTAGTGAGGGGAGGSIYITSPTITGTTGTFTASGGDGADDSGGLGASGGGGAGGRVAIVYNTDSLGLGSSDFTMTGGSGPNAADDGERGTVYVVDDQGNGAGTDDVVNIFHGFTFDDTDHSVTSWTIDAGVVLQKCDTSAVTPSITTSSSFTFVGSLDCDGVTSFTMTSSGGDVSTAASSSIDIDGAFTITSSPNLSLGASSSITSNGALSLSASTSFTVGTGVSITNNTHNTDMDFTIPAANNQTWTNVTITGAAEGDFTIDDAIGITLAGTTAINANAQWTALTSLDIASGATISANGKGCVHQLTANNENGYGPNGSNVCAVSTAGYGEGGTSVQGGGGGGYGSFGGESSSGNNAGGTFYNSAIAPVLFGSSGGRDGLSGAGAGGGAIRLIVNGTLTHEGTITANGGDGTVATGAGGGGSGGAIYITTDTIAGSTGTFSATGGDGADDSGGLGGNGGGGGGGRIAIVYDSDTLGLGVGDFTMTGGSGPNAADDGEKGTVYIKDDDDSRVDIFHGFTYAADYSETTWNIDSGATSQYCDTASDSTPSVTATDLDIAGDITCDSGITSFNWDGNTSFDIASGANLSFDVSSVTVDFDIPAGDDQTWNNVDITLGAQGDLTINDAAGIALTGTTTITSNTNFTNLSFLNIGSGTSIVADGYGCPNSGSNNSDGYGPNGSNVCAFQTAGYGQGGNSLQGGGGGGHGGAGGDSSSGRSGGTTYGSITAPVLFGSSGGRDGLGLNGEGGGKHRLDMTGALTLAGTISADGGAGTVSTGANGGGSGGSIYITAGSVTCSAAPDLTVAGGAGANGTPDGGGGGGGRIAIDYTTDNTSGGCAFDQGANTIGGSGTSTFAAGGSGPDSAVDGSDGTLSLSLIAAASNVSIDGEATNEDLDGSYTITPGSAKGIVDWKKDSSSIAVLNMPFEVDSSGVSDYSDNSNDGTINGATFLSTGGQDSKGAYDFDGSNDDISIADSASLDITDDISISMWVKPDTLGSFQGLIDKSALGAATGPYAIEVTDMDELRFYLNTSTISATSTSTLSVGVWTHVVATYDRDLASENAKIYINGVQEGTGNATAAIATNNEPVRIGVYYQSPFRFDGVIDEVKIFDTNLSADQVSNLYSSGSVSGSFDTIDSEETSEGDEWQMCVTPNNSNGDGTEVCSSTVTITAATGGGSNTPAPSSGGGGAGTVTAGASLELTGPPSGSVFNAGQLIPISWNSTGNIGNVTLSYSTNGGQTFTTLAHNIGDTGLYNWRPPVNLNSDNVLLRVIASDGVNLIASDNANGPITIGTPIIDIPEVVAPDEPDSELGAPSDATDPSEIPTTPSPGDPGSTESPVQFVPRGRYVRTDVNPTIFFITPEGNKLPALDTRTFLTHKENFTEVVFVTDEALHGVPYQAPLLPRPGTVLATFQSDPRVYWIEHNPSNPDRPYLRHIDGEHLAAEIFGLSWRDYVLDMNPAFQAYFEREKPILTPEPLDKTQLQKREILSVMAGMRAPYDEESHKALEIASMKAEHRPWYRKLVDKVRNVFR